METADAISFKAPSPLFLQVVQEIGHRMGLDAGKIGAGASIEYKGVTFWLNHHGALDPDGLMLLIHMGSLVPEVESAMYRRMLEHNVMTPAAVGGYYGILPGTDTAALCIRLDMASAAAPVDAVLGYVGLFARQVQELSAVMDGAMVIARQQMSLHPEA